MIARWARISNPISGIAVKFFQKMLRETPKAIDGTIKGILTSTSKIDENTVPSLFLAMRIAIGKPIIVFIRVAIAPTEYDKMRLCQYPCQFPTPATASFSVPFMMA